MSVVFTVALCTHNHADRLARTLDDLALLREPEGGWELLVVDNGCSDGTGELLRDHRWRDGWNVRVVSEPKLGLSNARNRAISDALGEFIIFIDDDETPDPDWLRAFERLVGNTGADAFGGRIRVLFEDRRPPWLTDELLGFLGELNRANEIVPLTSPDTSFYGGNFGFRKSVCDAVGGFDDMLGRKGSDNTGGEEVDFYRRLLEQGFKVWWTPEAVIHHRIQASKLDRGYFLDLHYRQGRIEGIRTRGARSRIPPPYLFGQLGRAMKASLLAYRAHGRVGSLRTEMNVAYFLGKLKGWIAGPRLW